MFCDRRNKALENGGNLVCQLAREHVGNLVSFVAAHNPVVENDEMFALIGQSMSECGGS